MTVIEVFEPALCCNTGVCGEDVDQALVTFSADLDWTAGNGATITRHNLANYPMSFAQNPAVKQFLQIAGSDGLPLVLVDGVTVLTGTYPDRTQLATWAGISTSDQAVVPAGVQTLGLSDASSCCSDTGDTGDTTSCC